MKYFKSNTAVVAVFVSLTDTTAAFAPVSGLTVAKFDSNASCFGRYSSRVTIASPPDSNNIDVWKLYAHDDPFDQNELSSGRRRRLSRLRELVSQLKRKSKPATFALATAAGLASLLPGQSLFRPPAALASAPIVLRKSKPKDDPPIIQAMKKAEELKRKQANEEFDRFMQKCIEIEESEGKQARAEYEKQYNIEKQEKEAQKAIDVENLKRDLLDEGKDPNTDMEGENEVWKFEHGVDLAKVPGTRQNEQMIREFQSRGKDVQSFASQRYIVKCQVADLKARGIDPLAHFSEPEVIEKTRAIYKMDDKVAAKVAKKYEELMAEHGGRLTPAQEGEKPFVRSPGDQIKDASSKVAAQDLRSDAKAERSAEKEVQRKAKAEAKAQAKADRAAAKEKQQQEKKKAKEAAVAASAAEKRVKAEAKAKSKADRAALKGAKASKVSPVSSSNALAVSSTNNIEFVSVEAPEEKISVQSSPKAYKSTVNVINVLNKLKGKVSVGQAIVVATGGVGAAVYGFTMRNEKSEEDREKQFKAIMGYDDDDDDENDDGDDDDHERDDRLSY